MERTKRLELNALSKEVFGTPSKWQSILSKGRYVPTEVTTVSGKKMRTMKWTPYTVEEVESSMREVIQKRNEQAQKEQIKEESKNEENPVNSTDATSV